MPGVGRYIRTGENPVLISENFQSHTETHHTNAKNVNGKVKPEQKDKSNTEQGFENKLALELIKPLLRHDFNIQLVQ